MDVLNFNIKLNQVKIKNKCTSILKYFLIHAYACELVFLLQTFGLLKMKYRHYENFIEKIQNIIASEERHNDINGKIQIIVNLIYSCDYYDLYEDIISALDCTI
jgi:hypothetical protein